MLPSRSTLRATLVALLLFKVVAPARAQATLQPYASIASDGESYAGPRQTSADDLKGSIIRIGLLAPLQGVRKNEGDAMVAAAQMALHDNAPHGAIRGRHIALAVEDASAPSWGLVSNAVIRLALNDNAVAVITSTSGTDTHLVEQVGNRIGFPVLTLSSDATTTQIDIPWIFRVGASDAAEAQVIARDIYGVRKLQKVLLITQEDYEGKRGVETMRQAALNLNSSAPNNTVLDATQSNPGSVLNTIETASPQAIILWTNETTAASLLHAVHTAGVETLCYLPENAHAEMNDASRTNPKASEAWMVADDAKGSPLQQSFAIRFRQATGASPSPVAAKTYDAVAIVLQALTTVGTNRVRIRHRLAEVHGYEGASGEMTFDREGNDPISLHLVELK